MRRGSVMPPRHALQSTPRQPPLASRKAGPYLVSKNEDDRSGEARVEIETRQGNRSRPNPLAQSQRVTVRSITSTAGIASDEHFK